MQATMVSMGDSLLTAATAIRVMMVEQLGLAMIPLWLKASAPLTSGTTRGTSGSRRKLELLSTNTAPAFTMAGANFLAMPPPTAPRTKSMPSKLLSQASSTVMSRPLKGTVLPALRALARGRSVFTGKSYSSKTLSISRPTAPVAPKTATLYSFMEKTPFAHPANPSYSTRMAVSKLLLSTPTMMEISSAAWLMMRMLTPCSPSAWKIFPEVPGR